jgi:hypothetical protein
VRFDGEFNATIAEQIFGVDEVHVFVESVL